MKNYNQTHIIAIDKLDKYEQVTGTPEFYNESAAIKFWELNKQTIQNDHNTNNYPFVIVRKEVSCFLVKEL